MANCRAAALTCALVRHLFLLDAVKIEPFQSTILCADSLPRTLNQKNIPILSMPSYSMQMTRQSIQDRIFSIKNKRHLLILHQRRGPRVNI